MPKTKRPGWMHGRLGGNANWVGFACVVLSEELELEAEERSEQESVQGMMTVVRELVVI